MKQEILKAALLAATAVAAPFAAQAQQAATTSQTVASAPGKAMIAQTVKAQAVIDNIDGAKRTVGLKTHDGRSFDIVAGPEVKNFDQLKVGDKVNVKYVRALSLELKKVGAPTATTGATSAVVAAPAGSAPAAAAGAQVTVVADVTALDAKTNTVTLKGPQGKSVDLKVPDPGQFKMIKVGDKVEAVYTEALAVSVESSKK